MLDTQNPVVNVPIRRDEGGAIRVSATRVTLAVLLETYKLGYTPQELHEAYDVLPLADIYAVIAYYHQHRAALDAYLQGVRDEGERLRREIEAKQPPQITRAELLQRLEAQQPSSDPGHDEAT